MLVSLVLVSCLRFLCCLHVFALQFQIINPIFKNVQKLYRSKNCYIFAKTKNLENVPGRIENLTCGCRSSGDSDRPVTFRDLHPTVQVVRLIDAYGAPLTPPGGPVTNIRGLFHFSVPRVSSRAGRPITPHHSFIPG